MQYTKQKMRIILIIAVLLCSGLAFSQDRLKADDVISYFASLYAPDSSKKTTFSMSFGNESISNSSSQPVPNKQLHQRNFVR